MIRCIGTHATLGCRSTPANVEPKQMLQELTTDSPVIVSLKFYKHKYLKKSQSPVELRETLNEKMQVELFISTSENVPRG